VVSYKLDFLFWWPGRFQREGVRFALRHDGRALIADDMGLGKTVQVGQNLPFIWNKTACSIAAPWSRYWCLLPVLLDSVVEVS
jgi:SNF2 family DNA or RNA helicase